MQRGGGNETEVNFSPGSTAFPCCLFLHRRSVRTVPAGCHSDSTLALGARGYFRESGLCPPAPSQNVTACVNASRAQGGHRLIPPPPRHACAWEPCSLQQLCPCPVSPSPAAKVQSCGAPAWRAHVGAPGPRHPAGRMACPEHPRVLSLLKGDLGTSSGGHMPTPTLCWVSAVPSRSQLCPTLQDNAAHVQCKPRR